MEELNLTQGHTYLIRYGGTETLHEIKVLTITEKAYQIRWQSGTITWEMKRRMDSDYTLLEDISDFPIFVEGTTITTTGEPLKFDIKWSQCHVCKGFGTVPDPGSTTGNKLCPLCFGSKMVSDTVQVKS
jgi:hypothetical protein